MSVTISDNAARFLLQLLNAVPVSGNRPEQFMDGLEMKSKVALELIDGLKQVEARNGQVKEPVGAKEERGGSDKN